MAKKTRPKTRTRRKQPTPLRASAHVPPVHPSPVRAKGSLIIIGGHENKDGHRPILEEVARRTGRGKLVVATIASSEPDEQFNQYRKVFRNLGVTRIVQLDAQSRDELAAKFDVVDDAKVVFFAGGDQLKITSRFGGTLICDAVRTLYAKGATIAGTSSGASVMSETMLIAGDGGESHQNGRDTQVHMAPGLGFMPGVIIDQHFAERGRIGRLLGAVAQNPRLLGIGIDEDTAAVFDGDRKFSVMGTGAVYVVDGRNLNYTDIAEDTHATTSIHGVILHVLATGDEFDLGTRQPIVPPPAVKAKIAQQLDALEKAEGQHQEAAAQ